MSESSSCGGQPFDKDENESKRLVNTEYHEVSCSMQTSHCQDKRHIWRRPQHMAGRARTFRQLTRLAGKAFDRPHLWRHLCLVLGEVVTCSRRADSLPLEVDPRL